MKFKFKNLIAFTLSEMMIVLLIVSVISAATIPTITQQKQKPYNVTENNSTSANETWKYDNFSGITASDSLSDNDQKVVIGTDTKSYTASQINDYKTAFDGTRPALVIQKNQGTLATNADRGQMVLYDRGKYVGSVGLDASNNIMIGANALTHNKYGAGSYNTAIGYYAGNGTWATPSNSVMIGEKAMSNQIPCIAYSIAIGRYAAYQSSFEFQNISIGECANSNVCYNSVKYQTKGPWTLKGIPQSRNIAIGSMAGRLGYMPPISLTTNESAEIFTNNISIGYFSGNYGYGATGNNGRDMQMENISIGVYSGLNNRYANTINVGTMAGGRTSTGKPDYHEIKESNINIGYYAGANNDTVQYSYNAALVSSEGQNVRIGNYAGFNSFGLSRSVTIGSFAGAGARGASYRSSGTLGDSAPVAIGYYAMYGSGASFNVAIGAYANYMSGAGNIAIGRYVAYQSAGATNNIFIGKYAGMQSALRNSIAIGNLSGVQTSGDNNVFIGYGAGRFGTKNVSGNNKYLITPYSASSLVSDTGNKFSISSSRPQMIIGPGYGFNGGAIYFSNTRMLLYASKVYARQTTMTLFSSDRRAKENIKKAKYGIKEIRNINTYTFKFKDKLNKNLQVGLIAQEVQKYIPEAVEKTAGGKLSIKFDWILFPVANAIKDVDKTFTQMNKDLIAQAKQLVSLERHVDKLENKVRTTSEKQEKMQNKLNKIQDILDKMENK